MSPLTFTPLDEIPKVIQDLRDTFESGLTKPLAYRKEQLKGLHNLVAENEDRIREALYHDLRKPPQETRLGETGMLKQECVDAIKNLDVWAAPRKVSAGLIASLDTLLVRKEPFGNVLIVGAWNYPLGLLLIPAVGAIAAGNTVLFKPSELSAHTAALLTELLPKYLDSRSYRIVNGSVAETSVVLEHRFDHIFFTGSGNVGKVIMTAAAKHLTPVTLELGGKSPAFVSKDANISVVARRLTIGKFFNCGQTCIAPDYIIVERGAEEELVNQIKKSLVEFYGASAQTSHSYGRIINQNHFRRLKRMLENTKGQVVLGGDTQEDDLYIAPTVVVNTAEGDSLLDDEIFGPIFPIMVVDSVTKEGVRYVNKRDQPLALYIFSENKDVINHILDNTRSGSALVNDTLLQYSTTVLPFGGVGPSGIGSYHHQRSFDAFSHERSTIIKSTSLDRANDIRYPPYSQKKTDWASWFMYDNVKYPPNAANPGAPKAKF